MNDAVRKLDEISCFSDNWNGYGAKPVPAVVIDHVRALLGVLPFEPELFPSARESIQLEYDLGVNHLEIEIMFDDLVYASVFKRDRECKTSVFGYDRDKICAMVSEFFNE